MWNIIDQWIVLVALFWSLWIIIKNLMKKSFLSCESTCDKKIFDKKIDLVELKRKARS